MYTVQIAISTHSRLFVTVMHQAMSKVPRLAVLLYL